MSGGSLREAPVLRLVHAAAERGRREAPLEPRQFVLGVETDRVQRTIRLDADVRRRHLYVSGMPGTGKSTLLLNLVRHDLATGNGCCVLDPHGGLVDEVLATCGADAERIVVVDAAESEFPVGIDLLNARSEYEQDLVVQFFLDLFSRMYLPEQQGPMLFQAVRNGLLLLMGARRTLAEFPLLFTDAGYLKQLLAECADPFVKRYFERIWNRTTDFHKSEHLAYFTSKFSPFFEDRLMRNILAQAGGLDFDAVLAERKAVLVNLARGRIGDTNARLLGQVILNLIRRSAMRRDPTADSPLFSVVVDEAHEFTGGELREMVTAMRKFGVGVVLANQSVDDFSPSVRNTILGAVGTFIVLRQGPSPNAAIEAVTQPRFDRRDLMRLPDHTGVVWSSADSWAAAPQRIRLNPPPRVRDPERAELVRRASAMLYGRPRAEVEAKLLLAAEGMSAERAVSTEDD